MGQLKETISRYWDRIQENLFPWLEETLPPLNEKQRQLVSILEIIRLEEFFPSICPGSRGRPEKSRSSIARAFVAKSVYNMQTTTLLIERLHSDISLRRICGWESRNAIPSESVFSRAFAEFSQSELPSKVHENLIKKYYKDEIVGHAIMDSAAIDGWEKPEKKVKEELNIQNTSSKTDRKKQTEIKRIEKQVTGEMTLEEMLADLPLKCDRSGKMNAKGNLCWWTGYKLHLVADDHGIPLAAITSSASLHDSQAAIPLAKITAQRVINLYDLMDSAYYAPGIIEHSMAMGHVPIIEKKAKSGEKHEKILEKKAWKTINFKPAEMVRYEARTTVERTFSRLKNEFGVSFVRVRGGLKVATHLMFCVLSLAADQLMKLVT